MKNCLFFCLAILTLKGFAQHDPSKLKKEEDYNLFISGGCHIGFWTLFLNQQLSSQNLPYNIHVDKVFEDKYTLGLGYSYENYTAGPITGLSGEAQRQNIRIRFYKYLTDYEKKFSIYMGTSAGVSIWTSAHHDSHERPYWPTAQFLFGMKVKFSEAFFLQTELGIGPPYAFQTSLGVKF